MPTLKLGEPKECLNSEGKSVPCANPPGKRLIIKVHEQLLFSDTCLHRGEEYYQENTENCAEYYRCIGGVAYAYKCPLGTLWSREVNSCDFDFNVVCGGGGRPNELFKFYF